MWTFRVAWYQKKYKTPSVELLPPECPPLKEDNSGGRDDEDSPGGVTGFVAEKAKEGPKTAAETVVEVGDKAKEAVDEAWGAAKETTRKIKEAVAGDHIWGRGS